MNFIRENLLKITVIIVLIVIVTVVFASCGSRSVTVTQKYEEMENNFKEKTISFVSNHNNFLPKEINESAKINMRTLISNGYIKQYYAKEDSNVACKGYVSITKKTEKTYKFTPFIQCGKYYETKTLYDFIVKNDEVVTSGDGLYKYDDVYVYRGENPKNYLTIGDKTLRIISFTSDGVIRVIDTTNYKGRLTWDDRYNSAEGDSVGINDFEKSRIKEYLNQIYEEDTEYITSELKDFIIPYDICVAKLPTTSSDFSGNAECQATSQNQYLGLMQLNEYFRASIDGGCKDIDSKECMNYNYFSNVGNSYLVTQNAVLDNTYQFFAISGGVSDYRRTNDMFNPNITFYLDSNSLYKDGDGSKLNPYQIR